MATRAPSQPVSNHYLTQAGLAVALAAAIDRMWSDLTPGDLASLVLLRRRVEVLVNQFSLSSATIAARAYTREREAAGIRSPFTVPLAEAPDAEQVAKSLSWSTRNLQTLPAAADLEQVVESAKKDMEGAATRLVLNRGRETTVDAVESDRHARAWARETRPGCCYWCAAMSSRGAVYTSAHAAGDNNTYHDHCRCAVVPEFGKYEPTAHARQWANEWDSLKEANGGHLSMEEWRRHFEGRSTTSDPRISG